jgi:hypothetical protein
LIIAVHEAEGKGLDRLPKVISEMVPDLRKKHLAEPIRTISPRKKFTNLPVLTNKEEENFLGRVSPQLDFTQEVDSIRPYAS